MTDKEIIKALEYCSDEGRKNCKNCPIYKVTNCFGTLSGETVDLINRLQAEIDRLYNTRVTEHSVQKQLSTAKSEAIKEFAERLKNIYIKDKRYDRPNAHTLIDWLFANIDSLVKEMVGEN